MFRRLTALVLLAFSFALAGADDKDPKPKDPKDVKEAKDGKELDGTYRLIHAELDGKLAEKATIDTVTVTIKGEEFTLEAAPNDKKVSKIKLAPDPKLSTIDISPLSGTEQGKTFPGIYKLDKGELTIAFSEKGDRPKEFKSDNGVMLLRLKKAEK